MNTIGKSVTTRQVQKWQPVMRLQACVQSGDKDAPVHSAGRRFGQ